MNDFSISPLYGIAPPRELPRVSADVVLLHAERFHRAAAAQASWSERAKLAIEYYEGKQWSESDLRAMEVEGRPALTINKIKPLVNLVLGYHITNATDLRMLPGSDASGTAEIAEAITHTVKQISQMSGQPYIDTEVFLDGLVGGRGYFDTRLNWDNNDFGESKTVAVDPFTVYPDPDAQDYNLNASNFIMTSRFVSHDEVQAIYGDMAAAMVNPLIDGNVSSPLPSGMNDNYWEITPWRRFGGEESDFGGSQWANFGNMIFDWVDRARKSVRLLDIQHYVKVRRNFFIDLETGDRSVVPDHFQPDQIMKVIQFAQMKGEQVTVEQRLTRRLRWTQMIGDIVVYDQWSPYDTYTINGFFPYFRRGMTMGMVDDLLDPQDEYNRRKSARLNIIGRSSNTGWIIEKSTMGVQERAHHEKNSSAPGYNMYWDSKGGKRDAPSPINNMVTPIAMQQLQEEAGEEMKEISGINPDALGQVEKVQSGRAIEAKQRQTVIGLEGYLQNWRRSKELLGWKNLNLIQKHYTEQRIIRVIGEGRDPIEMIINQRTAMGVINNVTLGKYLVSVDETPLSASFLEGQFEELMRMKELLMPIPDDFLIDASSIGRKEELKIKMGDQRAQQALMESSAMVGTMGTAAVGALPPPAQEQPATPGGGGPRSTTPGSPGGTGPGEDQTAISGRRGAGGGNLPQQEPGRPLPT